MALPKTLELRIRAAIGRVHKHRLEESLALLENALQRWRAGELSPFDLDTHVRQHQMRSKHHWNLYSNTAATSPEVLYIMDEALELGLISAKEHRDFTTFRRRH